VFGLRGLSASSDERMSPLIAPQMVCPSPQDRQAVLSVSSSMSRRWPPPSSVRASAKSTISKSSTLVGVSDAALLGGELRPLCASADDNAKAPRTLSAAAPGKTVGFAADGDSRIPR
jgi:hypothetical protein